MSFRTQQLMPRMSVRVWTQPLPLAWQWTPLTPLHQVDSKSLSLRPGLCTALRRTWTGLSTPRSSGKPPAAASAITGSPLPVSPTQRLWAPAGRRAGGQFALLPAALLLLRMWPRKVLLGSSGSPVAAARLQGRRRCSFWAYGITLRCVMDSRTTGNSEFKFPKLFIVVLTIHWSFFRVWAVLNTDWKQCEKNENTTFWLREQDSPRPSLQQVFHTAGVHWLHLWECWGSRSFMKDFRQANMSYANFNCNPGGAFFSRVRLISTRQEVNFIEQSQGDSLSHYLMHRP